MWQVKMRAWIGCLIVLLAPVALLLMRGMAASKPSSSEAIVLQQMKHHLFVRNKAQKNPLPPTPETVAEGKEAFSHYCAACHGLDGQNSGVPFADRMSPPVPLLSSKAV